MNMNDSISQAPDGPLPPSVRGIVDAIATRSGTSEMTFIDHDNAVVPW